MRRTLFASAAIGAALAVHGATPAAFAAYGIPAGGVATRSNTAGLFAAHALPAGRIAHPGATRALHDGVPASPAAAQQVAPRGVRELAASLRDSDPTVRAQAACSLRELGD